MTLLRSLLFNVWYVGCTAVLGIAGLPVLPFGWRANYRFGRIWSRALLAGLRLCCGLAGGMTAGRLPEGPVIVAMKHQSAWDTLFAATHLPCPAFVLKRELLRLPLVGWYLWRCRMVPIDRKGGSRALKSMLAAARDRLAAGRPLVIYPEGTRTTPGETPRYHPGVAALYLELGVPVVPIALNSGCFWGRQSFLKRPGRIAVEVLETIPPGLDRREFMHLLQERIEGAAARLAAEAKVG